MSKIFQRAGVIIASVLIAATQLLSAQIPVIIDTDLDSDVDDVAALAMALNLHKQNKINILGVVVTSDDPFAPVCASAINQYFGFPDLPIAFDKQQPKLTNYSRYTKQISDSFPHKLASFDMAEEPVQLYKRLLANAQDTSVVIVTLGHLSSLQAIMKSEGGSDLIHTKVNKWICMGGMFPIGKEANFYRPDSSSTVYCVENWKRPVTFCGWEAGNQVLSGGASFKAMSTESSPVFRGFRLYNNFAGRPSWDQLAILMLTETGSEYFELISNGICKVDSDGTNHWIEGPAANQSYIKLKQNADKKKLIATIDQLTLK
ncbi:MAG: nucleoside hydrolase [Flavitalea sp.]